MHAQAPSPSVDRPVSSLTLLHTHHEAHASQDSHIHIPHPASHVLRQPPALLAWVAMLPGEQNWTAEFCVIPNEI